MKSYDAIVIGAGLGGLAAAARLARAGLSVRLLERQVQPGGYATTFFRDPFEFEVSLHELSDLGAPGHRGGLYPKLEALGLAERVEFLQVPHFYRSLAPGLDLRVPFGREASLEALLAAFPAERRGLARLWDHFFAIAEEIRRLGEESEGAADHVLRTVLRYPRLAHAATVPLATVLDRELRDPLARLAVAQLWSYLGLPPSQLSLVLFAGALTSYLEHGAAYPVGKSQALSNAFVTVIEEAGGEVSLGNGARRVLCQDGRVTGVLTEEDEHLAAEVVVANANPITTALDLIGREHLPQAFLRRLAAARPSLSSFCVYLGLSRSAAELGLEDHEVFINQDPDLESQYASSFELGPADPVLLTAYSALDPGFSPPGTSVATLTTLVDGQAWSSVPRERYAELKLELADALVERAARVYPALRGSVEVCVTSTPITNMRYTGNAGGAIYGFANTPAENPAFRLPRRGPLEGLWFAGAWTRPGGGYSPCISSGWGAAEEILTTQATSRSAPRRAAGGAR